METFLENDKPVMPDFLSGGGELGALIREFDWSATPLGPVQGWPQNLRTCMRIMLTSRQPMWLGWGRELIKLYNDPYKTIVGGKHPWALGQPAAAVWKDIWRDIEPLLKTVMEEDEGTYVESQLLIMERNGYPEETYYTFSYTPIPGDDGTTAGMICANTDDTDRIISGRQLKTITELGTNLADAKSGEEVIKITIDTLDKNLHDFPFTVFYSVAESHATLHKDGSSGRLSVPGSIDFKADNKFASVFKKAVSSRKIEVYEDLGALMSHIPQGAWEIAPDKAIILPVTQAGAREPYGMLVIGCNPYRLLDEKYSSFFTLVADQVATSFASVYAMEEERRRVEALAEIDRAKTTFFSNISHEFRTPLTLLMGPVSDTLADPLATPDVKERMSVAYRNVLRMQKLVNTLLEFSRIEAGRMDGRYQKTDIVAITEDLTSTFRAAVEKAGMELKFIAHKIKGDVYVDTDMWERIVLNLLSNAFKYSKSGTITVEIAPDGDGYKLVVTDTGIGIPADQVDKIFNRFHRVENSEGRSQEGTGIGLALVKELVKLHGGAISVSSTQGRGSSFTVAMPTGKEHLQADKVSADTELQESRNSAAYLNEALKWIGDDTSQHNDDPLPDARGQGEKKHTIVFADDNADMRDYIDKLLRKDYVLIKAGNGEEAFEKIIRYSPDLVLSDVMMPKLDGFGLLEKIRAHPDVKNTPVILLSAKAGEEAKIEGLGSGADDYMVKPFSARELTARVDANIKIAQTRLAAERNLRNTFMQTPVAMTIMKGRELVIELANDKCLELWGKKREEVQNIAALEAFPELVEQGFDKIYANVFATGEPFVADEMPVTLLRNNEYETLFVNFIYTPLYSLQNTVEGIVGVGIDVTEQVKARHKIEQAEERTLLAIESADLGTYTIDLATNEMITSPRFKDIWGIKEAGTIPRKSYTDRIHPDDRAKRTKAHAEAEQTGKIYYEARLVWPDGSLHWVRVKGKLLYDQAGRAATMLGVVQEITEQKLFAEELGKQVAERTAELQRSNEDLQQFAHVASHDLKEPVRKIKTFTGRLKDEYGDAIPERGLEFVGKIQQATERMIAMIEGVLNYSILNSAEQGIGCIDLDVLMDNILSDLEVLVQKKNAIIHKGKLPVIEGAEVLIYQLLYNLINNSLKFSSAAVQPMITISAVVNEGGDMVQIQVADNGIGFQNESAQKIFNTFTRLNAKDKYEGTGLGLALCKKIVERHHGSISAEGEKGRGATFTIQLPVYQKVKVIETDVKSDSADR